MMNYRRLTEKQKAWFEESKAGCIESQEKLAYSLAQGYRGVRKNHGYLLELAEDGCKYSQTHLVNGWKYGHFGIEVHLGKIASWGNHGWQYAQEIVAKYPSEFEWYLDNIKRMKIPTSRGGFYQQSFNLSNNKLRWYEAALAGSVKDQKKLVRSLFRGIKEEQDWTTAIELERAWCTGLFNPDRLSPQEISKLAELGHPVSRDAIYVGYTRGYFGFPKDEEKAKEVAQKYNVNTIYIDKRF